MSEVCSCSSPRGSRTGLKRVKLCSRRSSRAGPLSVPGAAIWNETRESGRGRCALWRRCWSHLGSLRALCLLSALLGTNEKGLSEQNVCNSCLGISPAGLAGQEQHSSLSHFFSAEHKHPRHTCVRTHAQTHTRAHTHTHTHTNTDARTRRR